MYNGSEELCYFLLIYLLESTVDRIEEEVSEVLHLERSFIWC